MRVKYVRWFGIGVILVMCGLGAALLVAYSGLITIAASAGHPAWMEWFLEIGMRRSVQQHSRDIVVPDDLQSMDHIRLGAAHFAGGCAECHGAPGSPRNPVYDYMLPVPPDLSVATDWSAAELFYIVRHGLQFTGMPQWSGGERADEVWSMVAFLQQLPNMSTDDYRALAAGNIAARPSHSVEELRDEGVVSLAREACDRCHDTAQAAPASKLVPRLAGQPAAYLARSLQEYARGERRSGFMQPVAAMLSTQQIEQLALHYSRMIPAPAPQPESLLSQAQQTEAELLSSGLHPDLRLPACLSCHRRGARMDYPQLQGQQADYIAQQLQLFRNGGRQHSAWGEVMSVIAVHLEPAQIDMLAQWLSQQPHMDAQD